MPTMKPFILFLCMTVILSVGGCASNRIIMTPPVKAPSVPASNGTSYKVDKVTVSMIPYALPGDLKGKSFSDRFARLAESRYPGLFKDTPEAVPVNVRIEISQEVHDGAALLTFMGTVGIFGGILPSLPWTTEWQVKVGIEDRRGVRHAAEVQALHRGWWSLFSPCGLITIPGDSDIPAVSTVMTGGPGSVPPELCDYVVRCMVDLTAKELLRENPVQMPEQPFLLMPGQPSAPLQMPAETVAPF